MRNGGPPVQPGAVIVIDITIAQGLGLLDQGGTLEFSRRRRRKVRPTRER